MTTINNDIRPEYVRVIQRTCNFSGVECPLLTGRRIAVCDCPGPHYTTDTRTGCK